MGRRVAVQRGSSGFYGPASASPPGRPGQQGNRQLCFRSLESNVARRSSPRSCEQVRVCARECQHAAARRRSINSDRSRSNRSVRPNLLTPSTQPSPRVQGPRASVVPPPCAPEHPTASACRRTKPQPAPSPPYKATPRHDERAALRALLRDKLSQTSAPSAIGLSVIVSSVVAGWHSWCAHEPSTRVPREPTRRDRLQCIGSAPRGLGLISTATAERFRRWTRAQGSGPCRVTHGQRLDPPQTSRVRRRRRIARGRTDLSPATTWAAARARGREAGALGVADGWRGRQSPR